MTDLTDIIGLLGNIQAQIEDIKDALGRLSGSTLSAGIDLGTGLAEAPAAAQIIPPTAADVEIVGGAATAEFPDCCAVGNADGYFCTGTLIAPNLVVTADHCQNVTRVFLKGNNVLAPQGGEVINVIAQHTHPEVDLPRVGSGSRCNSHAASRCAWA